MKDFLKDIIQNTHSMGFIKNIKIKGEGLKTELAAVAEDKTVIINAEFHNKIGQIDSTVGLSNLDQLNAMLNCPEYNEDSVISLIKNSSGVTETIHFENKDNTYTNNFRLMNPQLISALIPDKPFKGTTWSVKFSPSASSITKFKYQAQTHNDSLQCSFFTENKSLYVEFGDATVGHLGKFVFQPGVNETLLKLSFPVARISSILSLAGDKVMHFSNEGIMEILLDSGLALYSFKIPALSK